MDATIQALLDYVGSKLADAEALMAEMFLGEDADSCLVQPRFEARHVIDDSGELRRPRTD